MFLSSRIAFRLRSFRLRTLAPVLPLPSDDFRNAVDDLVPAEFTYRADQSMALDDLQRADVVGGRVVVVGHGAGVYTWSPALNLPNCATISCFGSS